ncbi:MAG: hypothetical protein NTX03_11595, partial [Bacteroidetes bacterium]|nr:hypothetical protein [Bacteroidota bacterium]
RGNTLVLSPIAAELGANSFQCYKIILKTIKNKLMSTWSGVKNPFLKPTEHNYLLMLIISNFHYNRLMATTNPLFFPMRDAYIPVHNAIVLAYNTWKASGSSQKTNTLTLNQQLGLSKTKLDIWEPAIMVVYVKTSPEYATFFPQGRRTYTNGTIESRISAFGSLDINLTDIVPLATTKGQVHSYYQGLDEARQEQQQNLQNSTAVEAARIAGMTQMWVNLCTMNMQLPNDGDTVASFYDVEAITNHEQLIFTGTLQPSEIKEVFKHKFDPATDHLLLINPFDTPIDCYFTNGLTDQKQVGAQYVHMPPQTQQLVSMAQLNYADDRRHLYMANISTTVEAHWEVDLQ